jgi:signal peptidase
MKYTTSDYLIDSFWFFEPLSNLARGIKNKLVQIYKKLSDTDLEYVTVRIIENLPLGALITFLGFLLCFTILKYNEGKYGNRISSIVTNSMAPTIPPGSLIFSKPKISYDVGDIISYSEMTPEGISTGKILTHRVLARSSEGMLITKGDANDNPDPAEVRQTQVLGRVIRVIPVLGYLEFLLTTYPGFLVLVAFPALMVVRGEVKTLKKELSTQTGS